VSPRHSGRIVTCTPAECRSRRDQARAFLEVAELVLTEDRREAHVAARWPSWLASLPPMPSAGSASASGAAAKTTPRPRICSAKSPCVTPHCPPNSGACPRTKTRRNTPRISSRSRRPRAWCAKPPLSSPKLTPIEPGLRRLCDDTWSDRSTRSVTHLMCSARMRGSVSAEDPGTSAGPPYAPGHGSS